MTGSPTVLAVDDGGAVADCADYRLCQKVHDWSGTDGLAEDAGTLIATPSRILLIVVLAVVVRALAHRGIRRLTDRTVTGAVPTILRPLRARMPQPGDPADVAAARRPQRAEAMGWALRVGNKNQGYAQVVIDMPVVHDTDLERCRAVMQEVADAQDQWLGVLLTEPESLGVEQITAEGVFLRLTVPTTNTDQWRGGRELRTRLEQRFVVEGFRTPLPLMGSASAAGTVSR